MKDKIHDLDKTGVVYHAGCKSKCENKSRCVGETDRVWRQRLCEHRVITHKEANIAHSIKPLTETKEIQQIVPTRTSKI